MIVTVDLPRLGRRERDLRTGFEVPEELPVPTFLALAEAARAVSPEDISWAVDDTLTWDDLEWLRSVSSLPLLVKGILTAEDAVLAAEAGAAGVVVSNHGGRQLDGVAAALDALPEVVEAVGDRLAVLMDGGIRRGADVVKALALGAQAVLAGRPPLWGLAVDGADGVERVLEPAPRRARACPGTLRLHVTCPGHAGACRPRRPLTAFGSDPNGQHQVTTEKGVTWKRSRNRSTSTFL